MPVIPPDDSVGLNALSRLARVVEAAVFLAATFFAGVFFAGALAVAVFLAVTFFAGVFFAGAVAVAVFLAATFFAGVFFAGAFEVLDLEAAVFVFLTDVCFFERVLVVTGFFAPVEAAVFFAAGLAFADVFLGAGCFDALAAD